ncbi:hypothetical protein [Riemerella columbipharyngis]|uniref:Uncharacterized protein n=1 Tax=Riemerella columbipharyngis TaxID=1071918 RepID=A0A1G7F0X2_9FLAO|nr:hypothetical protein [Riemerella columbipharyngis]SDE69551.1 hypothetical protein SAMN05421544_11852 [Riemerella columbipharyngis]
MKDFIKLLKNIFSREPFEQDIHIRFSLSVEQIVFIILVLLGLIYVFIH